jgi:hypothetical protein
MCFSSTASFTAAGLLLPIGLATLWRVQKTNQIAFAAIPLLFSFHQWLEGMLWLSFADAGRVPHFILVQAYSLFSQVIWPIYIPVAVLLLEPVRWRRKLLFAIAIAGAAVSVFLLYYMLNRPVRAVIDSQRIRYIFPHFHVFTASGFYLLGVCVAPLVSSHAYVRMFGAFITVSLAVTVIFYNHWFISVWCFFSAVLSATVFLHFKKNPATSRVLHRG